MVRRSDILLLALLLGVGIAYQLVFLKQGIGLIDEGHLANAARRVAAGEVLYRDVYSVYPPASFYSVAMLFELFGPSLIVARAFHVALTLALSCCVFLLCRAWMPAAWAMLAGLLVAATGWGAIVERCHYAYLYGAFPFVALLLLSKDSAEGPSWRRLFAVGLLAGLTLAFRFVPFIGLAAAVGVILLLSAGGVRRAIGALGPLCVGFCFVWIPIGLYFNFHSAAADLARAVFWTSFEQYVGGGEFNLPYPALRLWPSEWTRAGLSGLFVNWEFYWPLAIYLAAAIDFGRAMRRRRRAAGDAALRIGERVDVATRLRLAVLIFGALLFLRVLGRSDYYHLAPVLVPAYILGADFLARLWRRVVPTESDRWAPVVVVVAMLASFWLHGIDNETRRAFDREGKVEIVPGGPWVREAGPLDDLVRALRERTAADEPIVVLPFYPILYFLAERPNPTRYDWLFPGYLRDADAIAGMIKDIDESDVRVVVYSPASIDGRSDRSLAVFAPEVARYLRRRFEPAERFGRFVLMTRRER